MYLDNSDKDINRPNGDLRRAEAAFTQGGYGTREDQSRYFSDFSPTNFFVETRYAGQTVSSPNYLPPLKVSSVFQQLTF